jgi:hypothetical protein
MKSFLIVLVSSVVLSVVGLAAEPARPLTKKEAMQLAASANTPADHLRLAKYFELKADKLEAEAKEHGEMAQIYRARPTASLTKRPGAVDTAAHCERLSQDLAQAAKDAKTLAGDHEAMAKQQ